MLEIPVMYMHISREITDWAVGGEIGRKKAELIITQYHNFPKSLQSAILKELENFGLLKRKGRTIYIVNKNSCYELIKNVSKVNQSLGMF